MKINGYFEVPSDLAKLAGQIDDHTMKRVVDAASRTGKTLGKVAVDAMRIGLGSLDEFYRSEAKLIEAHSKKASTALARHAK